MARKITRSDDGRVYTIHLREGVYWQRPSVDLSKSKYEWLRERRELTAEDCLFAFNILNELNVETHAPTVYRKKMKKAVRVDRYTFKVIWKTRTSESRAATLTWYPMPKWLYTRRSDGKPIPEELVASEMAHHWANEHPVGTGPYRMVEFDPGAHTVMQRWEEYWGEKPPIDRIRWVSEVTPAEGYRKLRGDELDFARLSPELYRDEIQSDSGGGPFGAGEFTYGTVDKPAYYFLGWNLRDPRFASAKVRRALTHALDRRRIIDEGLQGLGSIQTGPFPESHWAASPEVEPYPFDLARARQLLEEAGWRDRDGDGVREKPIDGETVDFDFEMLIYNKSPVSTYIGIYKEDLASIGVELRPRRVG